MSIQAIAANTSLHHAVARSGGPNVREIHGNSNLPTDPGTGNISSSEQAKTERHSMSNFVLTAGHGLKLASAQSSVVCIATIKLASHSEPASEIVQQRETTGVHLTAHISGT